MFKKGEKNEEKNDEFYFGGQLDYWEQYDL